MKFRNDTDHDIFVFGYHFGAGATVSVSTTDPAKLAFLARNLTAVADTATVTAPVVIEAESSTVPQDSDSDDMPDVKPIPKPARRVMVRRRKRSE